MIPPSSYYFVYSIVTFFFIIYDYEKFEPVPLLHVIPFPNSGATANAVGNAASNIGAGKGTPPSEYSFNFYLNV